MLIVATHRMLVDAAPVTVMAKPPLVVSAVSATAHPVGALKSSIVDLIRTVEPALASRLIAPFISQAPASVPLEACSRAISVPLKK